MSSLGQPDGYWLVRLEGFPEVSTDDLTLTEVETAEKASGVPYSLMDPRSSIRIARALFVVCMMRAGMGEDVALKQAQDLRLRVLHGAFTWERANRERPAVVGDAEGSEADPPPSAATSVPG